MKIPLSDRTSEFADRILELVFPSRCVHCGGGGALLCRPCLDDSQRLDGFVCRRCAAPMRKASLCGVCAESPPPLARLIAVFQFDGAIRDAVHSLKYENIRTLAPVLAEQMALDPRVTRTDADALVPVPLHRRRMRERGYNQAELLARELGACIGMRVEPRLVARTTDAAPQARARGRRSRVENVRGAFRARPDAAGRSLILVDDVATTGSTLNACARALLDAGAKRVSAIVLAKEM